MKRTELRRSTKPMKRGGPLKRSRMKPMSAEATRALMTAGRIYFEGREATPEEQRAVHASHKGLKRGGPMRKVGKVGRRRLKTSRELTAEARKNNHDFCEVGPVLRDFGIDRSPCFGELTNAHSVKASSRGKDQKLDRETARCCEHHHYDQLDLQDHATQARVVREAIARR